MAGGGTDNRRTVCSTDMALVKDKTFKKYAKAYADDSDLFFKE
jgi:catalase (peroxidase I)